MQSPMMTSPHPKKQRSNDGVPVRGGAAPPLRERRLADPAPIDDALTRRRIQLQDLKRQQNRTDLLSKARSQLKPAGPGPPVLRPTSLKTNGGGPPPMPSPDGLANGLGHRRESDIFPTVPKSPSETNGGNGVANGANAFAPPITETTTFMPPVTSMPPVSVAPSTASMPLIPSMPPVYVAPAIITSMPPITTTSMMPPAVAAAPPPVVGAPTIHRSATNTAVDDSPAIVRRLDFAADATRTKSAPPVRRPPPPPAAAPTLAAEAPARVSSQQASSNNIFSPAPVASSSVSSRNINRAQRPSPITPSLGGGGSMPSSTRSNGSAQPRQAFLSSMHESADSPTTAAKKASELDLIRQLKKVHQDKEDAFRQVVRLREQIQKLQKNDRVSQQDRKTQEFQNLVEMANHKGDRAALKWAREQASVTKSPSMSALGPLLSPMGRTASPSRRAMTGAIGPGVRKRVSTPHPKRTNENGEETKFLAKATESNPDEFDSEVATYIVRRPYAPHNEEFWKDVGELPKEEYAETATVGKPFSLEIAAKIKADGSILVLNGVCNVRHKKPRSSQWRIFEDVDEMDKPLGSVMFIDGQANEGEYWLDEIYEEAMSTRDTYCSSLMATATALKSNVVLQQAADLQPDENGTQNGHAIIPTQQPPMMQQVSTEPPMMQQQPPMMQPVSNGEPPIMQPPVQQEVSVEQPPMMQPQVQQASIDPPMMQPQVKQASSIEQLQVDPVKQAPTQDLAQKTDAPKEVVPKPEKKKSAPPPEEEEAVSDVLSDMLGLLFVSIFSLGYFLLVKLPIRICITTSLGAVVGTILSVLWFYLADDHGAGEMGASLGYGFNRPGIQ